MDNKKTGIFIAERRKELGYNQKELAEKLNITDKAVSKWETGRSVPDVSLLMPLAEILDTSVIEILNGEKISEEKLTDVSDKIIVKSLEKSKSKIVLIIILVLILILGIILSYPIYEYVSSVEIGNNSAIASIVKQRFNFANDINETPIKIETKNKFTAYLFKNNEKVYMIFFQENKLFKNRMNFVGGAGADLSKLGLHSSGWKDESINIFFGADVNAEKYEFIIDGVYHSVPIDDDSFIDFYIAKDNAFRHPINFELIE